MVASFLAAAVQLTSTSDPEANFAAAEEQIELSVRRGAELVGLPENFAFMGEDQRRLELAPTLAERCSRFLVTMARRYQVTLLGGGFPVPAGEGITANRAELVGKDGHLAGAGADLLMVPAAFTAFTGKDHWQVLLQARSIENTAYVVAPAQTGLHGARRATHGHALVIDPWGTVLADAGVAPGHAIAPIDTSHSRRVRDQMPSLRHRRPALF